MNTFTYLAKTLVKDLWSVAPFCSLELPEHLTPHDMCS